jgi:hypothetical protein
MPRRLALVLLAASAVLARPVSDALAQDERTLREIYLPVFEAPFALKTGLEVAR